MSNSPRQTSQGTLQALHEEARNNEKMERITVRFPEGQIEDVDALIDDNAYPNRSEAIRDSVRQMLDEHRGNLENSAGSRSPSCAD